MKKLIIFAVSIMIISACTRIDSGTEALKVNQYGDNKGSADTLNNLSADTLNIVKEKIKEWESIPVLINPYTKLLEDINSKKRLHKQATYGPEECPKEANICGTEMCTAGHLVNMVGKLGYQLKNKYGWATTATMIHYKAHPDYPCQNFGSIPQEWAMAYIEEMADRESKEA